MSRGNDIYKNTSGYRDPTAGKAISHYEKERLDELLRILRSVADLAGYEIKGRIVLKNKVSRKVWR